MLSRFRIARIVIGPRAHRPPLTLAYVHVPSNGFTDTANQGSQVISGRNNANKLTVGGTSAGLAI